MNETKYEEIYKAFSLVQRKAFCVVLEKLAKKNIDITRVFINFILPFELGVKISISFYMDEIRSTVSYFIAKDAIDSVSLEHVSEIELEVSQRRYEEEIESYQRIVSSFEDEI